ncbi:GATA-type zinc finger protein 1 [Pleodorina starrii]|uniref:GATA-type zinc finger protein 1 n=1 Tax=Pleodorina starrii TaxID=330485 RepID=A0A9W6C041_9CHLO|nr:GATA-type zinc finger protein 1 [Pleodorina starrii]GLC61494.1 GATA-type zinc finger protein 1 [Pleodorina starrii]GLC70360.1 GATA-type zinc finger protein 1 [Pleodorina starrii]
MLALHRCSLKTCAAANVGRHKPGIGLRYRAANTTGRSTNACRVKALASAESTSGTPWSFGFQCNERYLAWDQSAQLQLLKIVLSDRLGCTTAEVEARAEQLGLLLPDLLSRIECTRVDILEPLLADLPGLTTQLIGLRECLPGVNLSRLVAKHPRLLQDFKDPAALAARLDSLRSALPGVNVPLLVDQEPYLLYCNIQHVLANCKRLMPSSDPVKLLLSQPQMVLSAVESGLSSAMDVEGGAPVTAH